MTIEENPLPNDEKQKPITPPAHSTHVNNSELVVSGQGANITINKVSVQDFMAIYKFARQEGMDSDRGQHYSNRFQQELAEDIRNKQEQKQTNSAFISYSSADKRYLNELHAQLAHFVREGLITYWDDTKIEPGKYWFDEIQAAIKAAKVAVFLVSPEFLASEFIARKELAPLLQAASQHGTVILSVISRPCAFHHSILSKFQAVNPPSKPLSDMKTRGERDKVWLRVAECIMKAQHADN